MGVKDSVTAIIGLGVLLKDMLDVIVNEGVAEKVGVIVGAELIDGVDEIDEVGVID